MSKHGLMTPNADGRMAPVRFKKYFMVSA